MRVCVDTTILLDILKDEFLSDFFIGGFASAKCNAILARDRGIYTKYFPTLVGYEDCLNHDVVRAEGAPSPKHQE